MLIKISDRMDYALSVLGFVFVQDAWEMKKLLNLKICTLFLEET